MDHDPPLPRSALWLGLGGLIPFLATAAAAALGGAAGLPETAWLRALAAYGATILSFLGAVHWGFALRARPDGTAEALATPARLGLGVVPALLAWAALLLPLAPGLALLGAGVIGTAAVETVAARRGLVPRAYLRLRWGLSLVAGGCLLAGALLA
jgi:hypothetical protein